MSIRIPNQSERDAKSLDDLAKKLAQILLRLADIHTQQVPLSFPQRKESLLHHIVRHIETEGGLIP